MSRWRERNEAKETAVPKRSKRNRCSVLAEGYIDKIGNLGKFTLFCTQKHKYTMSDIRIFKRKIYDRMPQWKQERDGKTALNHRCVDECCMRVTIHAFEFTL